MHAAFCSICLLRRLFFWIVNFCLLLFYISVWVFANPQGTRSPWCGYRGQRSKYKVFKRGEKSFRDDWLWEKRKQTKMVTWCSLELSYVEMCRKFFLKALSNLKFIMQHDWKEEILPQCVLFNFFYHNKPHLSRMLPPFTLQTNLFYTQLSKNLTIMSVSEEFARLVLALTCLWHLWSYQKILSNIKQIHITIWILMLSSVSCCCLLFCI